MAGAIAGLKAEPAARVVSVDALRGFDMFWLIGGDSVVKLGAAALGLPFAGALAAQLEHSKWTGFTFWDFIAPLFLFLVGMSLPYAISRRLEQGANRRAIYGHIVKRTLVLIALGLVFNGFLELEFAKFRWTGVLQRIALSYFSAALIVMGARLRGQILWTAGLLLGYWAAMALVPVPGFGAGVYTPEGNLAGWIDRMFLPGEFCCYVYGDNEGYLSTAPSVATVMLGVLCGHLLRSGLSQRRKLLWLAAGGAASILAGLLWGLAFPIITMLWTSSYTLYANGWCMLSLALFYWAIDMRGWRRWAFPFVVIGMNPLTIYVLDSQFNFVHVADIFVRGLVKYAGGHQALAMAAAVLAVKWLFLLFLYRKKIFLKA